MRFEVESFEPEHLHAFREVASQYGRGFDDWHKDLTDAASLSPCWTGRYDGVIVCCAGLTPIWPGRAIAWCVLTTSQPRILLAVTRAVLAYLEAAPYRRVEITVSESFEAGHQWARMLGFKSEGLLRCYDPMGADHRLYARAKEWHTSTPQPESSSNGTNPSGCGGPIRRPGRRGAPGREQACTQS